MHFALKRFAKNL